MARGKYERTPEIRAKIGAATRARHADPEYARQFRAIMSVAMTEHNARRRAAASD